MKKLLIALIILLIASFALAIPPTPPSTGTFSESSNYNPTGTWDFSGGTVTLPAGTNAATATDLADYANMYDSAPTNGHLVGYNSATKKLYGLGAKVTDNSTASHLLCKDSDGHVENCGGVTISGTTSPVVNINPAEVDGHTTSTDLTAAQVSNTVIHNYDQAASDVFLIAPAAAAGYSALFTVVTAQSNHWCFEAAASDKIYLIASAGTVTAGDDGAAVCMMAAQIGQSFACWTFKSGASSYDWMCKAISIGTSTFEAHASSE